MFMKTSLRFKLIASFLVVGLMLLGVGLNGIYSLNKVDSIYTEIANGDLPNIITLGTIEAETKDLVIRSFRINLLVNPKAEDIAPIEKLMNESYENVAKAVKDYEAVPFGEGEEALWKETKIRMTAVHALSHEILALAKSGKPEDFEAIRKLMPELPKTNLAFAESMNKNSDFVQANSLALAKQATETAANAHRSLMVGIALGFAAAMLLAFFISRYLANALSQTAQRLGDGSGEVAKASEQISSAGTELSASATEQAAALQQTVASLEQVSAMVNKNADNAKRSLETSVAGQEAATRGKQAVGNMINSIQEISTSNTEIMQQIETSNREIGEIVKVIAEIGNKTKVINDIVFQTKLLSFNASVEAARAGEHGKGFAVVAEEVGNLAQMSGNAAKEISTMLEGSIQKVEGIVQNTKSRVERLVVVGKEKVSAGSETATLCGQVLDEIVARVSEVNQMVGEIATACQEQAQGVQEINKAMGQMDQVTQQNAAAAQQSATAGEALNGQTVELESLVAGLRELVFGGGQTSAPMHTPTRQAPSAPSARGDSSGKVIKMPARKKPETFAKRAAAPMKKAVGSNMTPSENDPRFEDV